MTQKPSFSELLLRQIDTNDWMMNQWRTDVEKQLLDEHAATQYVRPYFGALYRDTRIVTEYRLFTFRQFEPTNEGYWLLRQFNFTQQSPIMCCICAFMLTTERAAGQMESILHIAIEDPYFSRRKIFIEIEYLANSGNTVKKLVEDRYLTANAALPREIMQFRGIIDQGLVSNPNN